MKPSKQLQRAMDAVNKIEEEVLSAELQAKIQEAWSHLEDAKEELAAAGC